MRRPSTPWAYALGVALLAVTITGCVTAKHRRVAEPSGPYPGDATEGPALDVVVTRERDQIRLVNRTPRTYDDLQLWLNAQYVAPVDRVAIGGDNVMRLPGFINGFGEAYPVGSFLRPERSAKLVLAELYDPHAKLRHKLVVQPPGTR